jgi:hypothetical protein
MISFPYTTEYTNGMIRALPNGRYVALSDHQFDTTTHESREEAIAWLQFQEDLALSARILSGDVL